jgi:hypothetical protein
VRDDLNTFLTNQPRVEVSLVGLTEQAGFKYNAIQLRGKIDVQIMKKNRGIGYKFIIPVNYPHQPPLCYVDEPINQEVIDR